MNRQLVESWLQNASLPFGIPRTLNEKGMWTVSVDGTDLTLAVSDGADDLLLCASLIQLRGMGSVSFYRRLLVLQSQAKLPSGVMFGLSEQDNYLLLFGRFSLRALDGDLLSQLLNDLFQALPGLKRTLSDMTEEPPAGAGGPTSPATVPDQEEHEYRPFPDQVLSDKDLLNYQLTQPIRF